MIERRVQRLINVGLFLCFIMYIFIAFNSVLINDDYMALYTMWLLSDGKEAGVDFNIDSYTLLFDLLAPLYYIVGERIEIVYFYRILFIFLILIASNQIYLLIRIFFNRSAALITLIFILTTTAMFMRGLDLRPDLIILVLWLQILVVIYVKKYKSGTKMFLIGFLCSCALLFKFKAILIVVVIAVYLLGGISQPHFVKKTVLKIMAFASGSSACIMLFYFWGSAETFNIFLDTTQDLLLYSVNHTSENVSLRIKVLGRYFIQDTVFWLLSVSGFFIACLQFKKWDYQQQSCLLAMSFLLLLTILANPHYHAYNLVTLYPLMGVFCAFSINFLSSSRKISRETKIRLSIIVISISVIKGAIIHYYRDNQHQIALHQFIKNNTLYVDSVFAYEGLGLFRPSTYHWRTSAIKINNYWEGRYNVWQEILSEKPILVLESYRIPEWLLQEDRVSLYAHYVEIAPHVLTLGFSNGSNIEGNILREGLYKVTNSGGEICLLDEKRYFSGESLWLKAGPHTLSTEIGICTIQWNFTKGALKELKRSNSRSKPYLYSP
ncbi:hypothetical protein BCT26_11700 [Vibrio lentus]|nr:hypothetical protein BCU96_03030 [Vibrio lentus]PMH08627.1 hypothetical protein BCU76_04585 [Vibrio lentus]PMJ14449.1 hypothetical protein BCU30_01065 [Vibrio lentus]PMK92844.1 hypothetical protein BCT89_20360 [Vibrio lentus]PMN19235.1 hypothetical protein BCT39_03435 [Vibrio lentus]